MTTVQGWRVKVLAVTIATVATLLLGSSQLKSMRRRVD